MNHRILGLVGSALGTAGLYLAATTAANAQTPPPQAQSGDLGEIVVTAQRREERSLDVPITITTISQDQLNTANAQNLIDIQKLTPSLRFDSQTGFFQPTIRGIGTGVTTSGGGSNVGIYIDGFYSPNPLATDFQLTNVTSIQVLKGPQGTLFGHNTTGGAIVVATADPTVDPHVEGKISYARFDTKKYQAYATGGVGIVAMDVEGVYTKCNNFITNIYDDDSKVGNYENWSVRTGIKAQFNDDISALFRYQHSNQDDPSTQMLNSNTDTSINLSTGKPWGIQTFTVPGTYTTQPSQIAANLPRIYTNSTNIEELTVKADVGFANLTSLSQYRQEVVNQSEALGQVAFTIFQLGLPIFDYTTSQEILLSSKPGPRLQWTAGLYYLSYRDTYVTYIDNFENIPSPPGPGRILLGGSSTTTQNEAGYFDATYEITPQLFVDAGMRYSHDAVIDAYWNPNPGNAEHLSSNYQNKVPSINNDKITPRVVVRYKFNDDSDVYASYAEGYKAAILDVGGSCQDASDNFKCNNVQPEDVHAYEVGYKFDNHTISNELAGFLYNYKNLQVSEYGENAQAFIVNAASSRIYGLEDDIRWNLNQHFQVNGGFAWTHARYLQFGTVGPGGEILGAPIYATCPPTSAAFACGPGSYDYVNNSTITHNTHMQHAPDYTGTLGPRVSTGETATGEYAASANLYYTSKIFMAPCGCQFVVPAYETLDVRFQWTHPSKKYYVAVFGANVTNDRYRTQVQYDGYGIGSQWSAPAMWGIELGGKY